MTTRASKQRLFSVSRIWKVVEDGFIKPKSIVGLTVVKNNTLKATRMKHKVV